MDDDDIWTWKWILGCMLDGPLAVIWRPEKMVREKVCVCGGVYKLFTISEGVS